MSLNPLLSSRPARTARNLWRHQRGLVLLGLFLIFLFLILNPFNHHAGPHLPESYREANRDGEAHSAVIISPPDTKNSDLHSGNKDEWAAIQEAEASKRQKEEARRKQVAEDRKKQDEEDQRKTEQKDEEKAKSDSDRKKKLDEEEEKDNNRQQNGKTSYDKSSASGKEKEKGGTKLSVILDEAASGVHNKSRVDPDNITTTLVMGRLDSDVSGVQWIHDTLDSITHKRIYIVDDPKAPLHLDRNKGREAMVYLRYIIDFYDDLDDVTLFFHASRSAWHNNVLFNRDAAIMINNLRRSHVLEVGYMNARCELYPGCPSPSSSKSSSSSSSKSSTSEDSPEDTASHDDDDNEPSPEDDDEKEEQEQEEGWIKFNPTKPENDLHAERNADLFNLKLWDTLFPNRTSDPTWLSEPCCSQFGLSREMIRSVPLAQYRQIHDWLLTTDEFDGYTGRIMEYVWQYLFLKKERHCPDMAECYCQGYGLCLIDDSELREYNAAREEIDDTLGLLGQSNVDRGCEDMERDSKEEKRCKDENPFLEPLYKVRVKKGELENRLPRRYGIMEP